MYTSNPWREMDRLLREMNNLFDGEYGRSPVASASPKVNVYRNEEGAVLTLELPGVEPKDLELTVQDNLLTIGGEFPTRTRGENETYHRSERPTGKFSRVLKLPFRIDPKSAKAASRNGVLTLKLERLPEDKPRKISIQVA